MFNIYMAQYDNMSKNQLVSFLLAFSKIMLVASLIIIILILCTGISPSGTLYYAEYITLIIALLTLIGILYGYSHVVYTNNVSSIVPTSGTWIIILFALMLFTIFLSLYLFAEYKDRIIFNRTSEQYFTYHKVSAWIILVQTILILYWLFGSLKSGNKYVQLDKMSPKIIINESGWFKYIMTLLGAINVIIIGKLMWPIFADQSTGG